MIVALGGTRDRMPLVGPSDGRTQASAAGSFFVFSSLAIVCYLWSMPAPKPKPVAPAAAAELAGGRDVDDHDSLSTHVGAALVNLRDGSAQPGPALPVDCAPFHPPLRTAHGQPPAQPYSRRSPPQRIEARTRQSPPQ